METWGLLFFVLCVCLAEVSCSQPALSRSLIRQAVLFLSSYCLLLLFFFPGGVGCACEVLSIRITAEGSKVPTLVELTL